MTTPLRLTEEFLLLALDDATGKPVVDGGRLKLGLAGAAVVELVLHGVLEIAQQGAADVKPGRLRRTGRVVDDELLSAVADTAHGRTPKAALDKIGGMGDWRGRAGELRDQLLGELAARGVLRYEHHKVLGLFPTTSWPTTDPSVEAEVRTRVLEALRTEGVPAPRTASLVALLSAAGIVDKAFREPDRKQLVARAKQVGAADWGGEAVRTAIRDVESALAATVVITTVVAAT